MDKQLSVFKGTLLDFFTGTNLSTTLNNMQNVTPGQFPAFGGFVKGDAEGIYKQLKDQQEKNRKIKTPEPTGPPGDFLKRLEDEKNKKKKDTSLLEMIVQNTQKANELTLRNMTYGGGQLAAQGISAVQMANYRSVGSPRINATNDISRGVKKEINATTNSNFLNFSARRS